MAGAREQYFTGILILGTLNASAYSKGRCFTLFAALRRFIVEAVDALPDVVPGNTIQSFDAPHRLEFKVQDQVFDDEISTVCDVACLEDLDCFSDVLKEVS
jgi:hypothetical protein